MPERRKQLKSSMQAEPAVSESLSHAVRISHPCPRAASSQVENGIQTLVAVGELNISLVGTGNAEVVRAQVRGTAQLVHSWSLRACACAVRGWSLLST